MKSDYKSEKEKVEARYRELITTLEAEVARLKAIEFDKTAAELTISNLKNELKVIFYWTNFYFYRAMSLLMSL
jgi:hypothetical protein